MILKELFELQRKLDQKIIVNHNLQEDFLLKKKILALQVEIGELANETRCFKYWSKKGPSEKSIILEEYVDCIHFILSIGIEKIYEDVLLDIKQNNFSITDQFLNIYIDINDFIVCQSKDHYITLFEDFLSLGISLDFSKEDIINKYLEKNEINHNRQENDY